MYLIFQIILCTFYACCWIYLLSILYYQHYIYPLKLEIEKLQKNNVINIQDSKYPSYNNTNTFDKITFPHYKIYSTYSNRNKIISYQLAEFLDIQPGYCMSKEDIYNLVFKYIKKHMIFHKNKLLIIPNIQLLIDENNTNANITLNNLSEFIEPHIKNV
jgi:hypothetical protein